MYALMFLIGFLIVVACMRKVIRDEFREFDKELRDKEIQWAIDRYDEINWIRRL